MNYSFCGVVEFRGVQDRLGTACGLSTKTLCYDCGTCLCSTHAKRCDLCAETFCPSCLSFHQSEHPKPASGESSPQEKRKSA